MPGKVTDIAPIFYRLFRWAVLLWGGIWRIVVIVKLIAPHGFRIGPVLFVLGWGLLPYLVLAWMGKPPMNRFILCILAALAGAWDASVVLDMFQPGNSTASLILFFQPFWTTVILAPLGWWLYRAAQGK
jgi:hypothetical protein